VNADRRTRLIVAGAWIALLAGAGLWALTRHGGPGDAATKLVDAIQGSAWGPLVFVAVYLARPLIFFSAVVLTVAGGFLFGPVAGTALVLLASNGSAMVAYGLARWLGGERFADPQAQGRLAMWTRRMRARSFETVIVMRLIYLPYDLVSYLAGALRIHPIPFITATAIGSAPATVAFVLFGASLESFDGGVPRVDGPVLIASAVLLVTGLGLSTLLRRRRQGADAEA
jgi:uncharacterized membrane protein YdjX (TVP38/TMEM64 family)